MWLIAEYRPVGLFSLKTALATSSGGKTLLVPTPYAIKMALLDAACRCWGVASAEAQWPALRDLPVALAPPPCLMVTNLFTKVLKPRRRTAPPGTPHAGPMVKSIAFREYVWSDGTLAVGLRLPDSEQVPAVGELLLQINYLGKRGGFVQLQRPPRAEDKLPAGFVHLNPPTPPTAVDTRGLLQLLDDCDPGMTFEHASIYSRKRVTLNKERRLHHVVLPYRLVRSSKSFSLYERVESG